MVALDWTKAKKYSNDPKPETWQQVAPENGCWQNVEATKFVRSYEGSNQFIHSLKRQARRRDWTPTVKQVRAIFAVKRAERPMPLPVFEKRRTPAEEALAFIRSYQGRSRFLSSLKRQATVNPKWVPSLKQVEVVLRIRGEEAAKMRTKTPYRRRR